jgi:hypothetical protein
MITNIEKYMRDLDKLIEEGTDLSVAILRDFSPDVFQEILDSSVKTEGKSTKSLEDLPSFPDAYQNWYTEALALVKQLVPDRLPDFVNLYQKPTTRKQITYENYVIEDALQGLQITRSNGFETDKVVGRDAAIPRFTQQLNIVKSVKKRFESTLFDIRQLVQADLFDSELDAAVELNKKGFVRAAGAVAGVVLEGHLQQVSTNHNLTMRKKNPTINDLAQKLNDASVIDTPLWRRIQHLADLRNLCDHKKKAEPEKSDIDELIKGVAKISKTLF